MLWYPTAALNSYICICICSLLIISCDVGFLHLNALSFSDIVGHLVVLPLSFAER